MSQPPYGQPQPPRFNQPQGAQWGSSQWGRSSGGAFPGQYQGGNRAGQYGGGFGNPYQHDPYRGSPGPHQPYRGGFQPGGFQQPGFQQPGFQPQWQPPRRRRSGSAWWILLPVVVLGMMVGYFGLSSGEDPVATGPGETAEYVNEDYLVPGVGEGPTQVVDTYDDPMALTENAFYQQEVPVPIRCEAAALDDVRDKTQLEARMTDLSDCLTRAFGPALEDSGFEPYQPRVIVFDTEGSSPCGSLEGPGAFFCGANQVIYVSADLSRLTGDSVAALDYVMAHEYGHNVQGRNGILVQRIYEQEKSYSEPEQLEVNRRLETQADCLAGTFILSATQALGYTDGDYGDIVAAARSVGDDQILPPEELPSEHGTSASRELWVERGLTAEEYAACNTFVAPASEVE